VKVKGPAQAELERGTIESRAGPGNTPMFLAVVAQFGVALRPTGASGVAAKNV